MLKFAGMYSHKSLDRAVDCLCLVYRHYGLAENPTILRERIKPTCNQLKAIARLAGERGFHADLSRVAADKLDEIEAPTIAGWIGGSFVVIERCDRQGYTILDPLVGRRYLDKQAFTTLFTGQVLRLAPPGNALPQGFAGALAYLRRTCLNYGFSRLRR